MLRAFEEDQDYLALGDQFDMKRKTARSIIVNFKRHGTNHPRPKNDKIYFKVDDTWITAFIGYTACRNPTIILKEIREKLSLSFKIDPLFLIKKLSVTRNN